MLLVRTPISGLHLLLLEINLLALRAESVCVAGNGGVLLGRDRQSRAPHTTFLF
jgi:hypothetical protein